MARPSRSFGSRLAIGVVGLGAALAPVAGGCAPIDGIDVVAPRLVGVDPERAVTSTWPRFTLEFSEPMQGTTLDVDPASGGLSIALAARDVVTDAFLSDFANPPLSEARRLDVVALAVWPAGVAERDEGQRVEEDARAVHVEPLSALPPRSAYVLLVSRGARDRAGNGLAESIAHVFETDAGAPAVVSTDLVRGAPSTGVERVVANRRRVAVAFDRPVVGVDRDTLFLDGAPRPRVASITLDAARTVATIALSPLEAAAPSGDGPDEADTACATLGLDATYALVATSGITDDDGRALAPYRQEARTTAACDLSPPRFVAPPVVSARADAAELRFEANEPVRATLRFGPLGGALDCLGRACPVPALPTATSSGAPLRYQAELGGLTVDVDYVFDVAIEDDAGLAARVGGAFRTAPVPSVAVNEVLADAASGVADASGEFVELASFADAAIDLTGWRLDLDGGEADGGRSCPFAPAGDVVTSWQVAPHGFLVVASPAFAPALYGLEEAQVSRLPSACPLVNEAQRVALVDAGGRVVSTMGAYLAPRAGRSLERLRPEAPDDAGSFCRSRADVGPTPGAVNSVAMAGCDD
jgi:hypothetical protein